MLKHMEQQLLWVIRLRSLPLLKHLALVAHHCYGSYDLAANCINHLATRGVLPADAVGRYLGNLKGAAAAAA